MDRGTYHGQCTIPSRRKNAAPTVCTHCISIRRSSRAILQDSPPKSEEGDSSSGNGEDSGSKSDAASGSLSDDGLRGSADSENGSQDDGTVHITTETGEQEEAGTVGEDEEITTDDTMVMYVNIHEPDLAARQQLIDYYHSMWIVNRSKEFFNNGIVNKSVGFKNRPIMLETRVVVANIKVFPDIYRTFLFHQFDWMDNASGEYSSHLAREFYSSYATTLMNFAAET
ncbi:hypothetical protein KY290_027533 [Solanum tuberosum]|uniref:Uncharacterized protein n=1 Tax=Solanum tuberosum TaxID=4113 RepID=A0ABQ7UF97_SOLTU|nr:hypothetical protein KY290_027533 [Solanum tuberosum]